MLLKNEDNALPLSKDTPISFFSRNSVTVTTHAGIMGHGSGSLKEDFEADGYTVNKTLWKFYDKGDGSSYGLGTGSISFGDEEDFAINECPLEKNHGRRQGGRQSFRYDRSLCLKESGWRRS